MIGGNFAEGVLWSSPPQENILDGQNDIWQMLETSIMNIDSGFGEGRPSTCGWHAYTRHLMSTPN